MSLHVKTIEQTRAMISHSASKSQDRIVKAVFANGIPSQTRADMLDDCKFLASRNALQEPDGLELFPTEYQPDDQSIIHFGRQDGLECMPPARERQASFDPATASSRFHAEVDNNDHAKRMAMAAGYGPNASPRNT